MEKEYKLSRLIIAVLVAIITCIALINEDISVKLIGVPFFTFVAVLVSFLGSRVSKKILSTGDKMPNIILRIIYYLALLAALIGIPILFYFLIEFLSDCLFSYDSLVDSLGVAIIVLALGFSFFVFMITPYIQTIIVLILRKIIKNK